jgi:putative DNA methylase
MKAETRSYPKRLIEVDLPIRRISAHARREKSIRHGHISTLHIWWARRPLAACRAVICASLWPDPADERCPKEFFECAKQEMMEWTSHERLQLLGAESQDRFNTARKNSSLFEDAFELRKALLDFISDFANWDNATTPEFIATSRRLTLSAHAAFGGTPGAKPLVIDPFAGGGAIPLEALRVGADAYASDLNPIPVLLNKVILEFSPLYGRRLAAQVRKWGDWVKQQAVEELKKFYPHIASDESTVAYMWARTVRCQGPGCGAELPLIGQTSISTKRGQELAFGFDLDTKAKKIGISLQYLKKASRRISPIAQKSSATCPLCGYTTPANQVREALAKQRGGSNSARLLAVVTKNASRDGKQFRLPVSRDFEGLKAAAQRLSELENESTNGLPSIPHEDAPPEGALGFRFQKYGVRKWRDLYTDRQLVALASFARIITGQALKECIEADIPDVSERNAVLTCLGLALGRVNDLSSTLCRWLPSLEAVAASNGSQNKMPMILDFVEVNPVGGAGGDWSGQINWICRVLDNLAASDLVPGSVSRSPAQNIPLPDDIADALVTDPPYYDAFGYSDLSEFFYPWLRRAVVPTVLNYSETHVPKAEEAISIGKSLSDGRGEKNDATYLRSMESAFADSRRVLKPDGIGLVVFANKTTAGWEAILEALIGSGWLVSASWPIDTERPNRQRAIGSAALQSSVHLVCRPRERSDGVLLTEDVGDWREVLRELPERIHEWMPRLAEEGVVGADAIFACLGPALEIFSRYSRVETAGGDVVSLKEYLESVWAAVSKEALSVIFAGASTEGFEPDARLTAMWLWTLTDATENNGATLDAHGEDSETSTKKTKKIGGFSLEYDTARKIAQGLGAHLEDLRHLVELSGDTARLLPVSERTAHLFGKQQAEDQLKRRKPKKKDEQLDLFAELSDDAATEEVWAEKTVTKVGETTLDRVHQSMILFAANRGEALKRFLVEEGAGRDPKFWRLAQALSALYPSQTDEKRWVDGVLARKKGLGL